MASTATYTGHPKTGDSIADGINLSSAAVSIHSSKRYRAFGVIIILVPDIFKKTAADKLIERYFKEKGLPLDRAVAFSDVYIIDRTSRIGRRSDIQDLRTEVAKGVALNIPLIPQT